jgi:hypothetical protein
MQAYLHIAGVFFLYIGGCTARYNLRFAACFAPKGLNTAAFLRPMPDAYGPSHFL